jgi:RHH-type transcriptional regulator, rel operon repressor / antitoxin RelB
MTDRAVISVHTDQETSRRLGELAEATGRKKSSLAAEAIERYLADEERLRSQIAAGMKAAAEGRVVAHDAVATWAASLGTDRELPRPKPEA